MSLLSRLTLLGLCTLTVVAFQNCGPQWVIAPTSSELSLFSGSCDSVLKNAFANHYRPFLVLNCAACHATGPGVGRFSSQDFSIAWSEFNAIGIDRIERNAVSPSHQPPTTGPQHQPAMTSFRQIFEKAQADFQQCERTSGSGSSSKELLTEGKANSQIRRTNWTTVEWDLENEVTALDKRGLFSVRFSIEIRYLVRDNQNMGYEFRNPSARLSREGTGVRLQNLRIVINSELVEDLTAYMNLNAVVSSTTATNLFPTSGNGFVVRPVATTDTFALRFESVEVVTPSGGDGSGGGVEPPVDQPLPTRVTYAELTGTDPALNVFARNCISCHNSVTMRGNLNLASQAQAVAAASTSLARMRNVGNPMPPSGVLDERQVRLVEIWIQSGTP